MVPGWTRAALSRCATLGQWLPALSLSLLVCELERLVGKGLGIADQSYSFPWEEPEDLA